MQHTLLAVTGMSPQVVTETLYAIYQDRKRQDGKRPRPWPTHLQILTTTLGKQRAEEGLLNQGHLARLCQELGQPEPEFSAENILVVPDAAGRLVEDARSLEDHEALADFIMNEVRDLTTAEGSVHASLAGGRKTMTFYLGYAMSLFGRRGDCLSHVLVSDGYESLPDFWYPSAIQTEPLKNFRGEPAKDRQGQPLLAMHAEVTLADIPFIRHRHNLPKVLLQSQSAVHFRDLVRLINLGDQPENLLLTVDLPKRRLVISDVEGQLSPVELNNLPLLLLAFYSMMARATQAEEKEVSRPNSRRPHTGLLQDLLSELLPLCGLPVTGSWQEQLEQLQLAKGLPIRGTTLDTLAEGMPQGWFDQRNNELRRVFEERLPPSVCALLSPEIVWSEEGERLERPGSVKGGGYGLPLRPENIRVIGLG